MNKHLNVLVVEDSEDDAALLLREIKKGGYDPTFVRVETAKDMLACLNDRTWDVVISDYSLPEFNAPEALKVLQGTGLDLPFIIVSGKVEEEVAVACMTAGAHDFINKSNLARLVPAIERELNEFSVRRDRKKAEIALKESEEKYSSLFKNNHSIILLIDPQTGNIVDANSSACNFYGYSPAELTQKKIQDINLLSDEKIKQEMNRAKLEQRNHFFFRHRLADGKIRDVEVYSGPITVKGKFLLYSIIHDITKRKQAEEALQKSEQKLIRAQEIGHIGDWENDVVTNKLTWSDELFRIYGLEPTDELHLETAVARIHPDDRDYIKETLAGWVKNGNGEPFEYRVVRPDGSIRHVYSPADVIRDSTGNVVKVYGVTQDITERKKAEQEITLLNQKNELILNSMGECVYGLDSEGIMTFVNPIASKTLGRPVNELIGRSGHADHHHTHADGTPSPQEDCKIYSAFRTGMISHVDSEVFWRADGSSFPVEYTSTPIKDENGQLTGAVVVFTDITERKQAEEKLKESADELARSNEELKSLDKMKDEFLSNVSHELKTPLMSIQGFAEVMQDGVYGPLNDKQKHAMDSVFRNSKRLSRLISSILYLTLQKSGRDTYTILPVDITEIIGNALIDISPQINNKDLIIENNIPLGLPFIKGDMDKLTQVFINLLENATKFTPDGGKITVAAFEDGENIHITVSDTGIGVPAEVISNLFDRFYQVDASTVRKYGGTGIGLYISKLIVEVHKGKIWAESEEGIGTTFHVVLPK